MSVEGWRVPLNLALPGRANRANAAMALTAARRLGVEPAIAAVAMSEATEIVGRYSVVEAGDVRARLLLAKNPAGWLEVLDVLRPGPAPVVVAINARIADGRDPSWLWDVPFERLAGRLVIASGERGRDLAVRLRYAEVDHLLVLDPLEAVSVAGELARERRADAAARHESETNAALRGKRRDHPAVVAATAWAAARRAREDAGLPPAGWEGPVELDVVGNYTSFQTLRSGLGAGARHRRLLRRRAR